MFEGRHFQFVACTNRLGCSRALLFIEIIISPAIDRNLPPRFCILPWFYYFFNANEGTNVVLPDAFFFSSIQILLDNLAMGKTYNSNFFPRSL